MGSLPGGLIGGGNGRGWQGALTIGGGSRKRRISENGRVGGSLGFRTGWVGIGRLRGKGFNQFHLGGNKGNQEDDGKSPGRGNTQINKDFFYFCGHDKILDPRMVVLVPRSVSMD